jgi:hypothetical protein
VSIRNVLICMPVLLIGGTEIHTLYLVRVLLNAGYQITVCCYFEYDTSMVSQMEEIGSNVILMKLKRSDIISI